MKIICVLGGTGFVGSAIVRQLSEAGYLVKVLTRNCQKGRHLASLKNVQLIECDPLNQNALKQILKSFRQDAFWNFKSNSALFINRLDKSRSSILFEKVKAPYQAHASG